MEITVEKTIKEEYVVRFFMKEEDAQFEFDVLYKHLSYFDRNKVVKVEGGYEYITNLGNVYGLSYLTIAQYVAITGDENASKFFNGRPTRYTYNIQDIMTKVNPKPEHLTRLAEFIRAKFEFFKSATVNMEYPARLLSETFEPDVSILDDGIVFKPDGAYRIHFTKITNTKFEDIEKKYKAMLQKKYEMEYRRYLNIFKDYMKNMQEALNSAQQTMVRNIRELFESARMYGFNTVQLDDKKVYLEYDYSKHYTQPVKPNAVIINNKTYYLTEADIQKIEKKYNRPLKMSKIYVDLYDLLVHTPGSGRVYVYADPDTVHVNVAPDKSTGNGKLSVCTGDLESLDSVGFIKNIAKLLFTMNCDSPFNGVLESIVENTILADNNRNPVQTEAELFSTR